MQERKEKTEVETIYYGKKVEVPPRLYDIILKLEELREIKPEDLEKLGFELIGQNKYTTDPCGAEWGIAIPRDAVELAIVGAEKVYYSPSEKKLYVEVEIENDCDGATGPCWSYSYTYAYPPQGTYIEYYLIPHCGPDGWVEETIKEVKIE